MHAGAKLAAFIAVVGAAFGGAMAAGAAIGPIEVGGDAVHDMSATTDSAELPRGLSIAQDGYRLVLDTNTVAPNAASRLAFRIVDTDGDALLEFDDLHERPLHLIVLSRNLVDYYHLHPQIDRQGRWTAELPALRPGSYRVFADFQPAGASNLTLGTDITVPGEPDAIRLPEPTSTDTIDGYDVTLTGTPIVGEADLTFSVEFGGEQIRTDPYLGAAGHLVAIRSGDLAYLHVHPHEDDPSAAVTFTGEFPTAGTYRLFFDFSHSGEVRTVSFTVVVADAEGDESSPAPDPDEGH